MSDVLQKDGPAQRPPNEGIGWLTTAGVTHQPQSSPVWFIWDGSSSGSAASPPPARFATSRPIRRWPSADDSDFGNPPHHRRDCALVAQPAELFDAYVAKYDTTIRMALQTTPEQLAADNSTTIRITPTRVHLVR